MSEVNEMTLHWNEFGETELQISVGGYTPKFKLQECALNVSWSGQDNGFICSFVAFNQEGDQFSFEFEEVFEFTGNKVVKIDLDSILSKRSDVDLIFEEILSRTAVIVIEKLKGSLISKNVDHFGHITLTSPLISRTLNSKITEEMMAELFVLA